MKTKYLSPILLMAAALACSDFSARGLAEEPETKSVKINDITLNLPSTWKKSPTVSQFRLAQFEIPAAEDDKETAELAIFAFPGGAGTVDANVKRWISQFQPEGRKAKALRGESPQGKYVVVDVHGTFNKPVGPPIRRESKPMPGARMVAVILQVQGKNDYYLKLTGSAATVAAAEKSLRQAFGADVAKEKEYKAADE